MNHAALLHIGRILVQVMMIFCRLRIGRHSVTCRRIRAQAVALRSAIIGSDSLQTLLLVENY